jgi:hypothetical protein
MKVWTCTNFEGVYPTGVAAVIVADNAARAAQLLNKELISKKMPGGVKSRDMQEVKTDKELVIVLSDGDY